MLLDVWAAQQFQVSIFDLLFDLQFESLLKKNGQGQCTFKGLLTLVTKYPRLLVDPLLQRSLRRTCLKLLDHWLSH